VEVSIEMVDGVRRVRRPLGSEPSVEAIVCFRDKPELLKRCVASLLTQTGYEHLAVALVDNDSVQAETFSVLDSLERDRRIRILHDRRPFNFAALNNLAAR